MILKIKDYLKNISPLNIFFIMIVIGLIYGSISLYTKYLGFSKFMNKTRVIAVKAQPVTIGVAQKTYRSLSTIESLKSMEITSKVNGIIDGIFFKEGSIVSTNQKLFSILASDKVGRTEIFAPFDGVIGLNKKNIGDPVNRGDVLTYLDNYNQMKLEFDLPERLLPYLNENLKFNAFSENIPEKIYNGTLKFIDTRINVETRTIKVYTLINNDDLSLKPGLLMKVNLFLEEIPNAILIPEEALLSINKEHYVYIVNKNVAEIRKVDIGIRNNAMIEIKQGLKQGDLIVYMGQEKLKDKSQIKIVE